MPCWVLSEGTVPSAVGGLGMVQVPRRGVSGEGTVAGGQWVGRGTVLRHPAVTPVLTLTLLLSLTCTRAPFALTQPCGSAEETPL